jgi:hypothetical protein
MMTRSEDYGADRDRPVAGVSQHLSVMGKSRLSDWLARLQAAERNLRQARTIAQEIRRT